MKRSRLTRKTPLRARRGLKPGKPLARGRRVRPVNPERRRARFKLHFESEERVLWLKSFPCVSCGSTRGIEYSHVVHGPCKTADDGVPQCADCHRDVHRGIQTHQRKYGVDLAAEAARFAALWREHQAEA